MASWSLVRIHWPLSLVLAAFLGLGFVYSVTMPIFEASDEMLHYRFVEHVRLRGDLPVQTGGGPDNLMKQEASQPPLYYAVMAAISLWTIDEQAEITLNPHARVGVPLALDNKNMALHTPAESFPYRGAALAVHLQRWASLLLGAFSVGMAYLLGLRLTDGNRALAAGTAAVSAFIPMFIFISASVNNDNLVIAISSLAILLLVRMLQDSHSKLDFAVFGLVLGLGALSKLSALGLFGPLGAVCLVLAYRERDLWRYVGRGLLAAVIAGAVAGWWYARNWLLYGDPTGLNAMLRAAGKRTSSFTLSDLVGELEGLRINFWGLLGGVNVLLDTRYYLVYDAIVIFSLVGLAAYLVNMWRKGRVGDMVCLGLVALWPCVVAVSLIRWTQMTMASQGRLLFPALGCISVLMVLGLSSLVPRRGQAVLVSVLGAGLFTMAALVPFRVITPAYSPLPAPSEAELATIPRPIHATYIGAIELVGCRVSTSRVEPGGNVELEVYWRALTPLDENLSVFVHLYDPQDRVVGQVDATPGRGLRQTSMWAAGEVVHDRYRVDVARDAAAPGVLAIHVGLYRVADMAPLSAADPEGKPLGQSVRVASVKLASPPGSIPAPAPPTPSYAEMGGEVALLGHALPSRATEPGSTLSGGLYWKALRQMDRDYTVFVQLIGPNGWAAGFDSQPMNGRYPTSFWDQGEAVVTPFTVQVGQDVPRGEYRLIVGMYDLASGQRLPAPGGDYVDLGEVVVR